MKLCGKGLHDLDDPVVAVNNGHGSLRCGPCRTAGSRAYRAAHPARFDYVAYNRAWRKAHPDRNRANGRALYAANPLPHRASTSAWRKAHPELVRAARRNSRHIRRAAIGNDRMAAAVLIALQKACRGLCQYNINCPPGTPATDLDHIIPLHPRAGEPTGRHVLENLTWSCHECNCGAGGKHNLPLDIWLGPRRAVAFLRQHAKLLASVRANGTP